MNQQKKPVALWRIRRPFNQLVGRTVDSDGDGDVDVAQAFVHNVGQIVLHYQSDEAGPLDETDLAHRYLWGSNVDELLATETIDETPGTADDTSWALTDHQCTVRDVVAFDAVADAYIVIAHMDYDSFGNLVGVPPTREFRRRVDFSPPLQRCQVD